MKKFHITKRSHIDWWKAWLIRLLSIVLALLISAIVIVVLTGLNPLDVFTKIYEGTFATKDNFWVSMQKIAMLLCIALAVTPCYKMKFWNLGAQGQVLIAGLASTACMFYIKDAMQNWSLLLVMLVASVITGAVWAVIPAIFKAKWNTNETLFTLMMNYVAIQTITFSIAKWVPTGSGVLPILNVVSRAGWIPSIGENKYLINILVVLVLTIFMYVYLKYSKHGYEISVVGESQNTAKYIGIDVSKVVIRTAAFSGIVCGIAGFLLVAGGGHTISTGLDSGNGFTAVLVSWLAKFNPIFMTLTSGLIVFLQRGAGQIATAYQMDSSISDIITGIILFFIIGSEFFINYKFNFASKSKKEGKKDVSNDIALH